MGTFPRRDKDGFDEDGIHKVTGTKFDESGYDIRGYDRAGFNIDGIHQRTRTRFSLSGFDKQGYDKTKFNIYGIYKDTGTPYDSDGYDRYGYNELGYDKNGYNEEGYNKDGYHTSGYNREGYNKEGYNKEGYNKEGYNTSGYDKEGFDKEGYNREGFDCDGYDKNGWNISLRNLPWEQLVSLKRPSNFYDLRQRKKELSFNFMNKPKHWVGTYYSKSHYPNQFTSDELTQTIIRNKHETNGNTPAQYISKLMHEYLTDNDLGSFDCIIPVANHKQNFEQISGAVSIGQELSKLLKIECLSNALEKTLDIRARNIPESQKREFWNNNDLYVFSGIHDIQDKKILLVDDVITHDYTISQCIYQLGNEGPKDITVLCAGRTMK